MEALTISPGTMATIQQRPRILLLAMLPIGDTIWLAPTTRALRARYPAESFAALGCRLARERQENPIALVGNEVVWKTAPG